jgi:hypothetical protein
MVVLERRDGGPDVSDELTPQASWEAPEFAVGHMKNEVTGKEMLTLQATTSGTLHRFYLCDASNYEEVARELHKLIMKIGREAKRAESGLVVVNGEVPNGLVRPPKGR